MKLTLLIAAILLLSPLSRADDAPAQTPEKPDIPALIKQLGDDSPKLRDQASQQLRKASKDALPALAEAQKSQDAEVVSRAQSITRQIDEDLHPKPKSPVANQGMTIRLNAAGNAGGGFVVGGNGNAQIVFTSTVKSAKGKSVSITNNNGVTTKETTVTEDDKTIKIREDAEGIAVTTTEKKEGKDVTETVKAKDKETLKKENPKTFELYEKHTKGDDIQINGAQIKLGDLIQEDKPAK